jgi:hypothetical protein
MSLSPEQTQTVASWVRDGASLSAVQKRLDDEFKISMTYMDVRFLVDDLDLTLIDPTPKADAADVTKERAVPAPAAADPDAVPAAEDDVPLEDLPPAIGSVDVDVDNVTLTPGAMASGTVTFSDGVTGKWIVDNQGRPGFTEVSQEGYQPAPEDAQAFMTQLGEALRAKGMA